MKKKTNFGKFLLLWSGELVSSIGGGLTSFGLGVYVFNTTGSAGNMALVTLLGFLPTLLLSIPAGVLADRYDRRLLMMLGDGLSALGILYILLRIMTGGASIADICIGVTISSVFSSLLEPSYRATVTDLLTEDEYSRASGMVSLAGSARYLISPVLAGLLLALFDKNDPWGISLLIIIDACTFFLTVTATAVVRKGLETKKSNTDESFFESMKGGWRAITEKRGIFLLIIVSSVMTCFMGMLQILSEPLILDLSGGDSATLGVSETICACGMLAGSLYLGIRGIKKNYVVTLSVALALSGVAMALFGVWENIYAICAAGFCFFTALPFANNCLDYLARTNIASELQGRAWGLIGFISQLGYVVAYSVSGVLADVLGNSLTRNDPVEGIKAIGVGRGAAIVIIVSGALLAITALLLYAIKDIRALESKAATVPEQAKGNQSEENDNNQ